MVDGVGTTPKEIPVLLPRPLPNSADYQEPANGGRTMNPTFMIAIPLGSISAGMIFDIAAVPNDQLNGACEQCPNALVRLGTASMGFGIALPIAN
jgi:hypothetical protein